MQGMQENQGKVKSVDWMMDQMVRICSEAMPALEKQVQELSKLPPVKVAGHLSKSTTRGSVRWIRNLSPEESRSGREEHIYLGKSEQKMVRRLAYKLWISSSLRVREEQLRAAASFLRKIQKIPRYSFRVMNDPDILKVLGRTMPLKEELAAWQSEDFKRNPYHPEMLKIHTDAGVTVRSKSEAIIVSELVRMKIPFRYECGIQLQSGVMYPDFTIRHPVTGNTYIWEHLGMMDDPAYAANAGRKIEDYIRAGYIPMVNFILTSETREHPLDYGIVRTLIEFFFQLSM